MFDKLKIFYIEARDNRHSSFVNMNLYILVKTIKKYPYTWLFKYINNIVSSYVISFKLHGITIFPKVIFDVDTFNVQVQKFNKTPIKANSSFSFIFQNFQGGNTTTRIVVSKNSTLKVENAFYVGNGVKLIVENNAVLEIRGSNLEISGITCDSIIAVSKKITIGYDSIISWGVYISDSSQHSINAELKIADISIGDNVWISEGVTIGPGVQIGNGSIVGSKSFLNAIYEENSLIVGVPAKVKKRGISWSR